MQQQLVPLEFPCVDGEVIAIVAAYNGKLLALEGSYAEPLGRRGDAVYQMMLPGSYAQLVYVPIAGGDPTAVTDAERKRYAAEVEIITAKNAKQVGLSRDAHLVRMEINGGRGSAATERRVIGQVIEVLDGTNAYPLDVSKVLHATLANFEKATSTRGARWRTQARKAADAAIKADTTRDLRGYKRSETLYAAYLARWSTDTNTLHITFYGRLAKGFWRRFKMPARRPHHRGPSPPAVSVHVEYPTEYAVDFEFDRDGKLIGEKEYPAAATAPSFGEFPEY